MHTETRNPPASPPGHEALSTLLDAIEGAASGKPCAGPGTELQALRRGLAPHIDGEAWLGGVLGMRSAEFLRLYQSAAALRRRLLELRDALGAENPPDVVSCIADLRERIASHLELERQVAGSIARTGHRN